jgi:hypothetical protein
MHITQTGDRVRVFFGTETRDGTVEHIDRAIGGEPRFHIRLSAGWVHLAQSADFIRIPRALQ